MWGRHFDWYHFRPLGPSNGKWVDISIGDIIYHWNSGQTEADRAKICIDVYWEVGVGEGSKLSIGATHDP